MDLGESAEYWRQHLALVGRTDALFADDAIARLHKASLGLPRAFNNAATAALIAATTAGKALVDDDLPRKQWLNSPATEPPASSSKINQHDDDDQAVHHRRRLRCQRTSRHTSRSRIGT